MKELSDKEVLIDENTYVTEPIACSICGRGDGPGWQVDMVFELPSEESPPGETMSAIIHEGFRFMKEALQKGTESSMLYMRHMAARHPEENLGFLSGLDAGLKGDGD